MIAYLVWICCHVVEADETSDELAVEEVVRVVDCPYTPVRIVIGVRTEAERTHCNKTLGPVRIETQCCGYWIFLHKILHRNVVVGVTGAQSCVPCHHWCSMLKADEIWSILYQCHMKMLPL